VGGSFRAAEASRATGEAPSWLNEVSGWSRDSDRNPGAHDGSTGTPPAFQ